jgi:hypothetical protein
MSDDPTAAPPNVPPSLTTDTDYSPSSDRDVQALQDDQSGSPALDDPDIDRDAVQVLPGTGDNTDDGQVAVDPGEVHLPRRPDADAVGPLAQRETAVPDDEP